MPIEVIPGVSAIEILKANPVSSWPSRSEENNRIDPLASPAFTPTFTVDRGESIFTIGSCFARNVENALLDRGFRLPSREILRSDQDFSAIGPNVLNNYGVPSIFNEIAWAFDLLPFDPKQNFFATGNGKYVDIHLNQALRPTDYETVERRRGAIRAAYRQMADSKVIIITLGLTECWFDKETNLYLNTSPRRAFIREFPERFELRVLDYRETADFLHRIFNAIKQYGRSDVRVVLTVSPVPLQATYRKLDVAVANMYSKSVLRAAAEEVVSSYSFADYFPSFESVLLSNRDLVWEDDLTHIKKPIIDLNVSRMVEAYVASSDERGESDEARLQRLKEAEGKRRGAVYGEFEGRYDLLRQSPELAILFAESAVAVRKADAASKALAALPRGAHADRVRWVKAQIAYLLKDYEGVVRELVESGEILQRRQLYWRILVNSYGHLERVQDLKGAIEGWAKVFVRSAEPYRIGGQWFGKFKDNKTAEYMFRKAKALADEEEPGLVDLDYAEFLADTGRIMLARKALNGFKPDNPSQAARFEELKLRVFPS